jgi:hypothetical protein
MIALLLTSTLVFSSVWAQTPDSTKQPDVFVGRINFPSLRWGTQKAEIPLRNNTDQLKFIIINTHLAFSGSYVNPERSTHNSTFLEPGGEVTVTADVEIPPNYGHAELEVTLYDVVDTLDQVLPGQKFYSQTFQLNFPIPDAMLPYMTEKLTFPSQVNVHPYFDNEFVRAMFMMLEEGKSAKKISEMAECDSAFVAKQIQLFYGEFYLKGVHHDSTFVPVFPIIKLEEAEQARVVADSLASSLSTKLASNLKNYRPILDSLVMAKVITRDSNDFISGSSCLYYEYPTVAGLLMWFDLGREFVTGKDQFMIFEGTDICNASNKSYIYEVQGGDNFNGSQFYALISQEKTYHVMFSDHPLTLTCPNNFILLGHLGRPARWEYATNDYPEFFIIDTAAVRPMLSAIDIGTTPLLQKTRKEIDQIATKFGHKGTDRAYRFWFWNLVATRTLDNLIAEKVVTKRGNGNFRFDSIRKQGKG